MLHCRLLEAQKIIFCNSGDVKSAHLTRVTNEGQNFASPYQNYFGFWRHSEVTPSQRRVEKTRITGLIIIFTTHKILSCWKSLM